MTGDWQVVQDAIFGGPGPATAALSRLREREAQLELDVKKAEAMRDIAYAAADGEHARVARLEEALRWCLEHRDAERFFSVGESALASEEEKT